MINRMIAALLALATILAAPVAQGQATPQFGIATAGACRDLSVRDTTLPGLVPFLCVDTSTHKTKIKTDGGSMTGDLSFGGTKKVIDLASPTSSGDATTKFYVDTNFQPVDTDLTSIAALATTSFGRSLLTIADAAALRTAAGNDRPPQIFVPVNGGTTTIVASTAETVEVYFDHASAVTGQTISFPTPIDGQRFLLMFREAMSSITFSAPTGTLLGTFASTSANARAGWVYRAATGRWYRYA